MNDCKSYTISEITDRFLMRNGIEKKKYFARYLVLAQECWEDIFQNTLWVIKSVWMPTKAGTLFSYVDVPEDCLRLFSVGTDDKCGLIQPLFYNNQLNVVPKPSSKKCGCSCSDCGGLCEDVNSTTMTTKLMFTISNVNYYQKCWLKYCPNGDVIEYCLTPTKKYNNILGDGGDYNEDYNDDYLHADPPFSDYTIEYLETQKKICKLEVKVCGCPVESTTNTDLFLDCCGFYVNWDCRNKKKYCKQFSPNINNNFYGEVKMSSCGNKIEYQPSQYWSQVSTKQTPDYLLVNYQTTGESVGAETLIPKYARNVMYAALDCGRKEYNSTFSQYEKDSAMYKYGAAKNEIVGILNPIDLIFMAGVQDAPVRF